MRNFNLLIEKEYKSAYESAYDLSLKKEYSTPKIYTANNDLSKRWYVYFSYRNPDTGKLKRQTTIYGEANKYKTKEERLAVLTVLRQALNKLLRQGYSPYKNNDDLYQNHQAQPKKEEIIVETQKPQEPKPEKEVVEKVKRTPRRTTKKELGATLKEAFDKVQLYIAIIHFLFFIN